MRLLQIMTPWMIDERGWSAPKWLRLNLNPQINRIDRGCRWSSGLPNSSVDDLVSNESPTRLDDLNPRMGVQERRPPPQVWSQSMFIILWKPSSTSSSSSSSPFHPSLCFPSFLVYPRRKLFSSWKVCKCKTVPPPLEGKQNHQNVETHKYANTQKHKYTKCACIRPSLLPQRGNEKLINGQDSPNYFDDRSPSAVLIQMISQ